MRVLFIYLFEKNAVNQMVLTLYYIFLTKTNESCFDGIQYSSDYPFNPSSCPRFCSSNVGVVLVQSFFLSKNRGGETPRGFIKKSFNGTFSKETRI